ncbi:Autophagy protein 22 [Haplosporangium bisporale]|nr:Autophagy protein 22 [Haplosporangium bisporale]
MASTHRLSHHNYSLSELDLTSHEEKQHKLNVVPLKRSEVWAWYIQNATYCGYGWVGGFLMIPLLIQDAASRNGVEASNHALPCNMTVQNFKCVTLVLGHYLEPGTISLYISSISTYRKSLLIVFSILGCINALGFFLLQSQKLFWVAAILSPLGWTFFNICGVFTHSYLPIYGRVHQDVLAAKARGESQSTVRKIEEQVVNDLSAYSVGIANVGSVIVHAVSIGISLAMKETYNTITSFRQLPEIFKFMIAWFILSDGANTIPAILFVIIYRELSFNHTHSLIISVLLAIMACLGAYFFLGIRKLWKLTTKFMIMLTLFLYALLLSYLIIVPYFTKSLGLRQTWEGWACTVYIGFIISTFYSSMRVMLSELCPEGDENEWFSLYLLADKGSSWMGPFVTGAIYTWTGDYRKAFWFPVALMAVGVLILSTVDMDKGKDEARNFAADKKARYEAEYQTKY